LVAVTVKLNGESTWNPGSGVPAIVAVPSLLSVNVRPGGSVPAEMPSAGAGNPVVVTLKL